MGYLTIDQIVTEGLELGGNPGIATRATSFLKFLLDTLARGWDWEQLLRTAQVTANAGDFGKISGSALPSDYRAVYQLHIDKELSPLRQVEFNHLDVQRRNDAANGVTPVATKPRMFAIDQGVSVGSRPDYYLWPKPDTRYTFNLRYYSQPDASTFTGSTKPWFEDTSALVMAVANFAQSWDQNTFQELLKREAQTIANNYRLSHRDKGRAAVEQLPFSEHHFKTFNEGTGEF